MCHVCRRGLRPSQGPEVNISWSFLREQLGDSGPNEEDYQQQNRLHKQLFDGSSGQQEGVQQQQPLDGATPTATGIVPKGGDHLARVNAQLNVFGEGLVNRLVALEDSGVLLFC